MGQHLLEAHFVFRKLDPHLFFHSGCGIKHIFCLDHAGNIPLSDGRLKDQDDDSGDCGSHPESYVCLDFGIER